MHDQTWYGKPIVANGDVSPGVRRFQRVGFAMTPGAGKLHGAWEALQASLSDLESFLITSRDLSDNDRASGYRLILGIEKWVVDRYFLGFDPERPRFIRFYDEFSQWGLGNPDNGYWIAEIRAPGPYLVTGRRGNATDLCIELRDGIMRMENGAHSKTLAFVDLDSLKIQADGRYRVQIGGEPGRDGNHLPIPDDVKVVFVRQTYADWNQEEVAPFWIEKLGAASDPAPEDTPDSVSEQITNVARRLNFIVRVNDAQVGEFRKALLTNAFPAPAVGLAVKSKSGFFPGQHNAIGWWKIQPDQALIISLVPPECRYLGFMIGHPLWFRALDFDNRQNSLNTVQAYRSSDGLFHYVLANSDPGVSNWIDCGQLTEGFMFFRCQGLTGTFSQPRTRIVALSSVRDQLPADEPIVSAPERNEILKRRRIGLHRRYL